MVLRRLSSVSRMKTMVWKCFDGDDDAYVLMVEPFATHRLSVACSCLVSFRCHDRLRRPFQIWKPCRSKPPNRINVQHPPAAGVFQVCYTRSRRMALPCSNISTDIGASTIQKHIH